MYLTTARTNLGLLISLLMQCPAPADERPLVDRLIGYTDAGLVHLKGLTKLEGLRLGFAQVTDAGLAHLKGLANLVVINLEDTKVTDVGIAKLRKALPNCKLEK